jgi:hypothetical protein
VGLDSCGGNRTGCAGGSGGGNMKRSVDGPILGWWEVARRFRWDQIQVVGIC